MINFIKALFKPKIQNITIKHNKFGQMNFDNEYNVWGTEENQIFHAIYGNISGPNDRNIEFIEDRLKNIHRYWDLCEDDLLLIAHNFDSIDKSLSVKELFKISAISSEKPDLNDWEICFETKPQYKWIYIGMQFQCDELVSNDIST